MRRACICAVAVVWLILGALAGAAVAHGGLQASTPQDGARVKTVPSRVTMTFSEVPSKDSVMKVVDGCRRDVVASTSVGGNQLVGAIGDAQPGNWKATYRVISAEDGHLTRGKLSFTVAGKKDCNPEEEEEPSDEPSDPGDGGTATPTPDDDSSFPVVPVAVGAAGLVIVGLVVRRVSAG